MNKPFVILLTFFVLLLVVTSLAIRDVHRYKDLTVRCVGVLGDSTGQLLECRELSSACMSYLKEEDVETYSPKLWYTSDEGSSWFWSFNTTLSNVSNVKTIVSNKTTVYVAVRGLYPAEKNLTQNQIQVLLFRDSLLKANPYY